MPNLNGLRKNDRHSSFIRFTLIKNNTFNLTRLHSISLSPFFIIGFVILCSLMGPSMVIGQTTTSSRPSTLAIQRNTLSLKQAGLERELNVVARCIKQAQLRLRDINGNINRTARIDLSNCGRKLSQIQRKLERLGKRAETLSRKAEAQAFFLRSLIERQAAAARISGASN